VGSLIRASQVFYANSKNAVEERTRQKANNLYIVHDESHPKTYILFPCDPTTREIAFHAKKLPAMTFAEFEKQSDLEQQKTGKSLQTVQKTSKVPHVCIAFTINSVNNEK
jgi:hypothetical protein